MEHIQRLFADSVSSGFFTDYDFSIRGTLNSGFSGGQYLRQGAHLFDVASLTKACNHLVLLRMFAEGELSPEDSFSKFIVVPQENGDDRKLWHFLCYLVQDYGFSYEALRDGKISQFKDELLSKGFKHWGKRFKYDNISSAYMGILLEKIFYASLEEIFYNRLLLDDLERKSFLFHPVRNDLVVPELVVPTRVERELRGRVHDPLSYSHQDVNIAVAGLFTTASILANIFHREIDRIISSGFYDTVAENQLTKLGIVGSSYGLGFDIPFASSLADMRVEGGLIFAGWTGCRIFFAKKPRVTICFLTNRVLSGETEESRRRSSQFSWNVIRETLKCVL